MALTFAVTFGFWVR